MNTILLLLAALLLVALLVVNRRRRARAAGPATGRTVPAPAAAVAETAAIQMPPPPPGPMPLEPADSSFLDWDSSEVIVEPGWPLPGEIAGTAPTEPVEAPMRDPEPAPEDEPMRGPYGEAWDAPEPVADEAPEPQMEAWVPGVSETDDLLDHAPPPLEPIASIPPDLPDIAPLDPPAPFAEPVSFEEVIAPAEDEAAAAVIVEEELSDLVWAEPAAPQPAPDDDFGAPAWVPPPGAFDPPGADGDEAEAGTDPLLFPGPAPDAEAGAEPEPAPEATTAPADPSIAEIAALLPLAVDAVSPVLAVSDQPGMTPRMGIVLRALHARPRTLAELAGDLRLSRTAAGDLCTRLEQAGLISRESVVDGGRRVLLVPTGRGRLTADGGAFRADPRALGAALAALDDAERGALLRALRALAAG